jgi:hypothetical protein
VGLPIRLLQGQPQPGQGLDLAIDAIGIRQKMGIAEL